MIKISELPAATTLGGTEVVAGVQSSTTVKILVSAIGTYVRGLFTTTPATVAEGGTNAATVAAARSSLGAAASGANSDITSILGLTGGINEARGSVAMHATTMDLWAQPNLIDGTGGAVTVTAIAAAPHAGARRVLYPPAGSIITNGATFAVDGGVNHTAAAGDKWEFEAVTVSTFKVHITRATTSPAAAGANTDLTSLASVTALTTTGGIDIIGTNTNDAAAAGYVGEYIESVVASVSAPASTQYGDLTSITLTAGDWEIGCNIECSLNGATITGPIVGGIGTSTGNNGAGLVSGSTSFQIAGPAASNVAAAIVPVRKSIAGSTTYYLKMYATYSAGTPTFFGRISARRVR